MNRILETRKVAETPTHFLDFDWELSGSEEDPTSRLLNNAWLVVNGVHMHFMAYAVDESRGYQHCVDDAFEEEWRGVCGLYDQAFCTIEINGRDYVIVAHPHGT